MALGLASPSSCASLLFASAESRTVKQPANVQWCQEALQALHASKQLSSSSAAQQPGQPACAVACHNLHRTLLVSLECRGRTSSLLQTLTSSFAESPTMATRCGSKPHCSQMCRMAAGLGLYGLKLRSSAGLKGPTARGRCSWK